MIKYKIKYQVYGQSKRYRYCGGILFQNMKDDKLNKSKNKYVIDNVQKESYFV